MSLHAVGAKGKPVTRFAQNASRALVLIVAVAATACGHTGDLIDDYCAYGAVSLAQLRGCEDHVDASHVMGLDTNAARYARGELDRCLADAGPFCVHR